MGRINYRDNFYTAKNRKFKTLKLRNVIICDFHQSEGCFDCRYRFKCGIKKKRGGLKDGSS